MQKLFIEGGRFEGVTTPALHPNPPKILIVYL